MEIKFLKQSEVTQKYNILDQIIVLSVAAYLLNTGTNYEKPDRSSR